MNGCVGESVNERAGCVSESVSSWHTGHASQEDEAYRLHRKEERYMHLYNTPHMQHNTQTNELVSSLKSGRTFSQYVAVASQFLDGNFNQFFFHKNQPRAITFRQSGTQIGHCSTPR